MEIDFLLLMSDKIEGLVDEIDKALEGKEVDKKIKSKLKRVRKGWKEQLERNESNAEKMGERNSMSKTDTDGIVYANEGGSYGYALRDVRELP